LVNVWKKKPDSKIRIGFIGYVFDTMGVVTGATSYKKEEERRNGGGRDTGFREGSYSR